MYVTQKGRDHAAGQLLTHNLTVVHKLSTSMINNKIFEHCNMNQILEEKQKGCFQKSLGCKWQLAIDAIVLKQAHVLCRLSKSVWLDVS